MKNKHPLWLDLTLISIFPMLIILASFVFFGHMEQTKAYNFIQTQKTIFKIHQDLEALRLEIRSTHNSFELKDTIKKFKTYHAFVLSSQNSLTALKNSNYITLINSYSIIEQNLESFQKYNYSGLNFEIENDSINKATFNASRSIESLGEINQSNSKNSMETSVFKLIIFIFSVLALTVLLIFKKISAIICSIQKINEVFSKTGETYFDMEKNQFHSGISEFDDIYSSSIQNSNEIFKRRKELIEKSRLAAIGETAAQIAHEILTPLTVIKMSSIKISNTNNLETQKLGQTNLKMIDRISKIITSTKKSAYANENESFEDILLSDLLEELKILVSVKINERKTNFEIIGETNLKIKGKEGQLLQVLINLINNSLDAIENNEEKWIKIMVNKHHDKLNIAIEDSGNGIPDEVLDKLFGSFFTTKQNGKGTGIGLNLSRKIIEGHFGQLNYNKESKHTQFVISIPEAA